MFFMDKVSLDAAGRIFQRVLPEIKPSRLEIETATANANRISKRLRDYVPSDVQIMVVGSLAHGTNLKGDADIDMFLLFGKEYPEAQIAEMGLSYAKKIVRGKKNERYEIKYAEHPYARIYLDDLNIKLDIVPAYKIRDINEMATAVDRSPLHVEFLNAKLSDRQRDEVRLLKYMLKAHGIYGAEVKTKGFAGYLCELLVYQYGSLIKLLEAISQVSLPICLLPATKEIRRDDSIFKKFNSRFVVIDPVDSDRNVAAGVSEHSLAKFVLVARRFIAKPDISIFYGKGFSSDKVHALLKAFLAKTRLETNLVVVPVPDKSEDTVWPQLNKVCEILQMQLEKSGFEIYIAAAWITKRKGAIMFLAPKLQYGAKLYKGPDVFSGAFSNQFIEKHKHTIGMLIKGTSLHSLEDAKFKTAGEALRHLLSDHKVLGRKDIPLKKAKLFTAVPRDLAEDAYVEIMNRINI